MKYMAIIDADEKPVSCEFIGCNGNVAPYLIGATTNIKTLEQEPCEDAISRRVAIDEFIAEKDAWEYYGIEYYGKKYVQFDNVIKELGKMPSVQPKPKTGTWMPRNAFLVPYKCSECNYESESYYNYCPNCGANMWESQESESE